MSSSRKRRARSLGQVAQALALIAVISAIVGGLISMVIHLVGITKKKIVATRAGIQNSSAIETVVIAYRLAEAKYVDAVQSCDAANPFLKALKAGAGCPGVDVTVFDPAAPDLGVTDGLYTFVTGGGCRITASGSTCGSGRHELIQMPMLEEARSLASDAETYHFFLTNVAPQRQLAELGAVVQGKSATKFAFALRGAFGNAAHLESDGRVTQENPDPLAYCQGQKQWADFLVYNPIVRKCQQFAQLGSGTGLAYHRYRYFGFRPNDGQVIDMLAAMDTASTSYLVAEDGTIPSTPPWKVFPPYNKAALINVDDITTIGEEVYYVALSGPNAHIGVLKPGGGGLLDRFPICPAGQSLGDRGWEQAYEGITALGASTPLLPADGDGLQIRLATFYLKTSVGDLITAVVRGTAAGAPYQCAYFKDVDLQQVEYRRTNGFDRTDKTKPYLIY